MSLPDLPPHPFPARMAPELALNAMKDLPKKRVVLDPMCGSGVVLKAAAEHGHRAIGFDLDPLAVLMARVWTTPIEPGPLATRSRELVEEAQKLDSNRVILPWIRDEETSEFVKFWFAEPQSRDLRRLAFLLRSQDDAIADALRIALSRIIITKHRGASLARDVSHSRPHRVRINNDFEVYPAFVKSAETLAKRLPSQVKEKVRIEMGDARSLRSVKSGTINAVVTSPPYLNAIDYLRGHKLSLVWLGYDIPTLREIRGKSIGSERRPDQHLDKHGLRSLCHAVPTVERLPPREYRMFERYVLDLLKTISEISRVLATGGQATFVVGDSSLRGVFVENSALIKVIAKKMGLLLEKTIKRELEPSRRYLPPPTRAGSSLGKRMRFETILRFRKC